MENKNWLDEMKDVLKEAETKYVQMGIDIAEFRNSLFYKYIIGFLKGEDADEVGRMHFYELKPLYDKYGYEKVNRILLATEKGGSENE